MHRSGLNPAHFEDPRSLRNSMHVALMKPPAFEPGTNYAYNNGNFHLLQVLIEELMDMEYEDFLRQNICTPLGVKLTSRPTPPFTLHYNPNLMLPGLPLTSLPGDRFNFGGSSGFGSADDLAKFMTALREYRILSRETTEMMFSEKLIWGYIPCYKGTVYEHHGFWTWDGRQSCAAVEHFSNGVDMVMVNNSDFGLLGEFCRKAYEYACMAEVPGKGEQPFFRGDGLICGSYLNGYAKPVYGNLRHQPGVIKTTDRSGKSAQAISFNSRGYVQYGIPYFPERAYSVVIWACPEKPDRPKYNNIFSAWCRPWDDPLRLVIDNDKFCAWIESEKIYRTQGISLEWNQWVHIAAVKNRDRLTLYINGKEQETIDVPDRDFTQAHEFGLGGNVNFSAIDSNADEYYHGKLDDFALYARALTADEIQKIYQEGLHLELSQGKEKL